jgi:type I restriction enzyme S subunit
MAVVEKARAAAQTRLDAVKALPAAFLRQVFPQSGKPLPEGWQWVKLGEVCQFVGGSQPPKGNFKYEPAPGYVRLVQIQDFRLSDVAVFIPEKMALRTFEVSDVMIGRYGPPVFQILRGLSGAYNVALMKTAPSENLDKGFLYFLLQWPEIQRDVIAQSQRSAGQSGVQKEYLEKYVIPLPPVYQQRLFAAQLNEQMAVVEKARAAAEVELNTINVLPASLLQRAFNGEI